jgi:hypothetical protein
MRNLKFLGIFLAGISLCAVPAQAQFTPTVRLVTKTNLAANTSTNVCPATSALRTEIQAQTGSVGLGLRNQTLTSATYGATASDPDLVVGTAGAVYTDGWGLINGVSAYGAAQIIICIQTIRG